MAIMGYLWIVLVLGVLATVASARRSTITRHRTQAQLESQFAASRALADEDVTKFGEEVQRLDTDAAGPPLDDTMHSDLVRALDAYGQAQQSLQDARAPHEIRRVTGILEGGRHAVASLKARRDKTPLPQKRPPCFFNPAHGPSSRNVEWALQDGGVRSVPACTADAERVLVGADPYIRTVQLGGERVPYWQGGPAYAPWAQGYYAAWRGSPLVADMAVGSMIFHGLGDVPITMDGLSDDAA